MSVSAHPATVRVRTGSRNRAILVLLIAAIVLGTGLVGVRAAWSAWQNRVPYGGPGAVAAQVSLADIYKDGRQAQAKTDELAGPDRLTVAYPDRRGLQQAIVGQLDFVPQRSSGSGTYLFAILDRGMQDVDLIWGVARSVADVGTGWNGSYDALPKRYNWLHGLASRPVGDGGYVNNSNGLVFQPNARGPITFTATLRGGTVLPIQDPSQLTFVLAFFGPHGLHWAVRVPIGTVG
ncbi:MAG: hypothetical protein ACR2KJ_14355 [Jatrophihabitans sp.]